jgi:hypothetical protein
MRFDFLRVCRRRLKLRVGKFGGWDFVGGAQSALSWVLGTLGTLGSKYL